MGPLGPSYLKDLQAVIPRHGAPMKGSTKAHAGIRSICENPASMLKMALLSTLLLDSAAPEVALLGMSFVISVFLISLESQWPITMGYFQSIMGYFGA